MTGISPALVRWLQGDAARRWFERLAPSLTAELPTIAALRAELTAEQAAAIADQLELRRRALRKFAEAGRMFFSRVGLEQATDERLASYKAARFPQGELAFDLCCGVGGDLLALVRRGPTIGFDRDPGTAALAAANLRSQSAEPWQVVCADAAQVDVSGAGAWHIDPDRRSHGRRTTKLDWSDPSLETLETLIAINSNAAIKLAPATRAPPHWEVNSELEWISSDGECRQQVAWMGSLASAPGRRRATIADAEGRPTMIGHPGVVVSRAANVGRFVYEPDAAVYAAGLVGALAQGRSLSPITDSTGYLTGDTPIADRLLSAFEVQSVMPMDVRRVKAHLRERGWGRLEIKKRGVSLAPEKLRQQLRVPGEDSIVLLITGAAKGALAIFARRLLAANCGP